MSEPGDTPDSLLTEDYLDERFAVFKQQVIGDFRREMTRLAVWITLAAVAGAAVSGGFAAILA